MNLSAQELEQIVTRVMEQLLTRTDSVRADRAERSPAFPKSRASADDALYLADTVITQETLSTTLNGAKQLHIGPRAILTPSARDFLRNCGVEWVREKTSSPVNRGQRWQAVITKLTPQLESTLDNLRSAGTAWDRHLLGLPAEAARQAVSAICRGEATGVVAFTEEPELVACLANRNAKVRAAAANNPQTVTAIRRSLGANVLAVNPVGKSFYELRNLVQTFASEAPHVPPGLE